MSPATRPLSELVRGLGEVPPGIEVSDVTLDSRAATPGCLFLACRGRGRHGLDFAEEAAERGARAILYEDAGRDVSLPPLSSGIFVAPLPDLSRHVGLIADRFFGSPSQTLTVAGITGTNGKTTCAWLLAQALQLCGRPAAYMGTLGFGVPPKITATLHTTSDAVTVHRHLAQLRELGAACVCMEVSSHALDQDRVGAVRFNTAAFTNLTRDHLDYHQTMTAYGAAKARLFAWPALAAQVINIDDPFGAQLARAPSAARAVMTTRAVTLPAELTKRLGGVDYVRATRMTAEPASLSIDVESSWGGANLTVPLLGDFNVDNILTVLGVLLVWNVPLGAAADALAHCRAPSGRMETFGGQGSAPLAIVDYAHTPDALYKALRAVRLHCRGKLHVVFGCGGDRDAGKRPLMGKVAAELADDIIVTDDNPRTEDPGRIVADVLAGITQPASVMVEHDRARAIQIAIGRSSPRDAVLIAGKGHEDYQIYGKSRRPFSDQAVVSQVLQGGCSVVQGGCS